MYTKQCSTTEQIYETNCTVQASNVKQKQQTDFYTQFQKYMESSEYSQSITSLTEVDFSRQLFTSVMFLIQENV